jgi:GNAT superfamily N-acetyltransferase
VDDLRIQRLTPDDWAVWRDARLASLADAPYAFGSTLVREEAFDEADWRRLLRPDNGMFAVAVLGEWTVGTIGVFTLPDVGTPTLVGMWVHADARGRGAGDALIADVLAWARGHGHRRIELRVADGNDAARRLFVRNGFVATGRREPLERDPTVGTEYLTVVL